MPLSIGLRCNDLAGHAKESYSSATENNAIELDVAAQPLARGHSVPSASDVLASFAKNNALKVRTLAGLVDDSNGGLADLRQAYFDYDRRVLAVASGSIPTSYSMPNRNAASARMNGAQLTALEAELGHQNRARPASQRVSFKHLCDEMSHLREMCGASPSVSLISTSLSRWAMQRCFVKESGINESAQPLPINIVTLLVGGFGQTPRRVDWGLQKQAMLQNLIKEMGLIKKKHRFWMKYHCSFVRH